MKTIKVELNPKSLESAIKQLQDIKKRIKGDMMHEYMQEAANWIINRANEILDRSNIGEDVKSYIFKDWDTEWIDNKHLKIINHSRKAVYVEFGVGIIGQTAQHPNASKAGYEYNVESEHKFGQGMWRFSVRNDAELDIPEDAIIYSESTSNGESIITQGTEGVWYLYNAVQDFKMREQKRLWEKIKKKYGVD